LLRRPPGRAHDPGDGPAPALADLDTVDGTRPLGADLTLAHVAPDQLGVALGRRAVAAPAAGLEADHVAGLDLYGALGAQAARRRTVGVEDVAGRRAGLATVEAVRAPAVAVGQDGERRRVVEGVVAPQAEAAAEPAGAVGVGGQLVAR